MFKIYDGRDRFYQWDLDRKVIVEDESITQVHFCNRTDDCSLVCEVYELDGVRVADVPNILLQDNWNINVYAYDRTYTKFCAVYGVEKRSKPADYVYTETETLNYNTLLEKLNGIETNIGEEVQKYMDENPVEVDLSDYYTKTETKELIPSIDGLATVSYVDEKFNSVEVDVDLSNYYTKSEVEGLIPTIPDHSQYALKSEIPKPVDLSGYALKTDIPDHSQYALKTDIPDHSQFAVKGDIPDVSQYQTATQVAAAISTALGDVELTDYYTKAEIDELLANLPSGGDIPSGEGVEF